MTEPYTTTGRVTAADRLPGDPDKETLLAEIVRVDQAGEYGAKRIYEGQLAVLGKSDAAPALRAMLAQEEDHLKTFNRIIADRAVRPTVLEPVWHVAGFALGAATALLGKDAAMACTVAGRRICVPSRRPWPIIRRSRVPRPRRLIRRPPCGPKMPAWLPTV